MEMKENEEFISSLVVGKDKKILLATRSVEVNLDEQPLSVGLLVEGTGFKSLFRHLCPLARHQCTFATKAATGSRMLEYPHG